VRVSGVGPKRHRTVRTIQTKESPPVVSTEFSLTLPEIPSTPDPPPSEELLTFADGHSLDSTLRPVVYEPMQNTAPPS
jgi:P pilus assembly chaperone PapD